MAYPPSYIAPVMAEVNELLVAQEGIWDREGNEMACWNYYDTYSSSIPVTTRNMHVTGILLL